MLREIGNENVRNLLQSALSSPAVSLDREGKRVKSQQVLIASSCYANIFLSLHVIDSHGGYGGMRCLCPMGGMLNDNMQLLENHINIYRGG